MSLAVTLALTFAVTVVPNPTARLPDAGRLVAGSAHTCAITADDQTLCWGANRLGQLGDGTQGDARTPVAVAGLSGAVELAAGTSHTCARRADGAVLCWGRQEEGELGDGVRFTGRASEAYDRMRLGPQLFRATPAPVVGLPPADAIFAGSGTTCATSQGEVFCWGKIPWETKSASKPTRIPEFAGAFEIAVGDFYGCALIGGEVLCFMWEGTGVPFTRVKIADVRDGWSLSGGRSHACVAHDGGHVRCIGFLDYDFVRAIPRGGRSLTKITDVAELGDVTRLMSAGWGGHTCAVRRGGEVRCWGKGEHGQLGHGLLQPWRRPVAVLGVRAPRALAGGGAHTCAITAEREVLCWGANLSGQLGAGLPEIEVPDLPDGERWSIRDTVNVSPTPVRALSLTRAAEPRPDVPGSN